MTPESPNAPKQATPKRTRQNRRSLEGDTLEAAATIRGRYREQIGDRKTAERTAKLFRAGLIQRGKPGRKLSESVAIALAMLEKGAKWREIYPAAIRGYRTMDKYERKVREDCLRGKVGKALRRRKVKPNQESSPGENVSANRGLSEENGFTGESGHEKEHRAPQSRGKF
jgi:hypothetical protein